MKMNRKQMMLFEIKLSKDEICNKSCISEFFTLYVFIVNKVTISNLEFVYKEIKQVKLLKYIINLYKGLLYTILFIFLILPVLYIQMCSI